MLSYALVGGDRTIHAPMTGEPQVLATGSALSNGVPVDISSVIGRGKVHVTITGGADQEGEIILTCGLANRDSFITAVDTVHIFTITAGDDEYLIPFWVELNSLNQAIFSTTNVNVTVDIGEFAFWQNDGIGGPQPFRVNRIGFTGHFITSGSAKNLHLRAVRVEADGDTASILPHDIVVPAAINDGLYRMDQVILPADQYFNAKGGDGLMMWLEGTRVEAGSAFLYYMDFDR